jgi:molybdopterin-guanine dinucleotide biosynthesis protein A
MNAGGFVLAGGRSSRMGTDKALLRIDGETLLERAAHAVERAAGSVTIVGHPRRYGIFGFSVIPDAFPDSGPLAGIHAALVHTCADWNLIAACDMPGLESIGLIELLEQTLRFPEYDVLIPQIDCRPHPLCAVYHRRALPAIEHALRAGRFKVMDALAPLRVNMLATTNAGLFENVNTPEDWRAFARP